ncbi:MAG: ATP-dependent zinc metalloprotease FtsH [Actinomycetota bacterium]|nr:ATP-dependent zinc metalloprotease FtsH [Actinomycetota bacterium]MDK1016381.1 ATP-dependent zinc metalloprotease FtsH [Actinomycetota bacterium]MDK1026129.1 ATP-dependent zinc metalloprotease FtsH [Actinomycetota bacterium]MDK1037747.1 ATP-dependent zinc metalloprotease FtsH [Actinomycetota bacterium]MDK1095970.1 ATP-dependent zinc metalloprotease FtsH [Actinomycetota bacterium]
MNRTARTILVYLAVIFLVVMAFQMVFNQATKPEELTLNEFTRALEAGHVTDEIVMKDVSNELSGTMEVGTETSEFIVRYPAEYSATLTEQLQAANVEFRVDAENPTIFDYFISFLPFLLIFGLFLFFMMQMQGGGNRVMQFGKSTAKLVTKDTPQVLFSDVAGTEEAVEELMEIKEFLDEPQKFRAMGAKIPKGVLLYGPPGTGKTLLARAVAGEAGVPFFAISGSDFVEMFVGVGASRVRDLFDKAKQNAPAIVFIDEIDAVGRHRGAGLGGGHDEREQTLNQLLVELDGFEPNTGVIVIASTNRPDILDPALLRPGRFDRQIVVDRPDLKGREAILEVHAKGKPLADGVDLGILARQTPGFTGADLANLINEAAILSARTSKESISMVELEESIERVIAGPERKSRVMSDSEKKITAYHEGGHALVGYALPNADPIHKVTIIPRGRAGGYTLSLPLEDKYYVRRSEMIDQLAMLLGGRTAEELIFIDPTTGAANDIEKATGIARKMVMEYGMSDKLGPLHYGKPDAEVFLGRDYSSQQDLSNEVASAVDEEIRFLINQAHGEARMILETHEDALHRIAEALIEKESLNADEIKEIFSDVPKWEHTFNGSIRLKAPEGIRSVQGGVAARSDRRA